MPEQRTLRPGQVAKLCKVAPRTVNKWIDSGRLKGFRLPQSPNSLKAPDRRVYEWDLQDFMIDHGLITTFVFTPRGEPWERNVAVGTY
jgi:hypothetical protein